MGKSANQAVKAAGKRAAAALALVVVCASHTAAFGQTGGIVAQLSQQLSELQDTVRRLNGRLELLERRLGGAPIKPNPARAAPAQTGSPRVLAPPAATAIAPGTPAPNRGARILGQIPARNLAPDLRGSGAPQLAALRDPDLPLEKYSVAYGAILRQDYREATTAFTGFLAEYPRHDLSGNAQYWLAQSYFARGKQPQAAREFLKSYKNFPNNAKAPESLLKLGMALAALGETTQACAAFREYSGKFALEARKAGNQVAVEMRNARC
ncbi:MAG: tol-pal system protein YbgF [Alphaproteobacteria bacterium]